MSLLAANGINLYYETSRPATGTAQRLLFIGGTGGDLRTRPNVFDGPLASEFELLSYDQRGLGRSDKPECDYSMADYADDAAGLLEALGWGRVAVMGVSFGGMVAQELALRHPHLLDRLVLACTSSGGEGGASFPLHELERLPEEQRLERQIELADLRCDRGWREAEPMRWQALMDRGRSARRADRHDAGAARQLAARAGHDTWARLPGLQMPVLLVGGRFDGIAPVANMTALANRIPASTLQFFKGGHLFLLQDATAYPYIIQWLKS